MISFKTHSTQVSCSTFEDVLEAGSRVICRKPEIGLMVANTGSVFLILIKVIVSNSVISKTLNSHEAIYILSITYS
jgi:hypothetical protein